MRRIKNDQEFLIIALTLLTEITNGLNEKKCLVFTPDNVQLPETKEVGQAEDFAFEGKVQDITIQECLRLYGVILYHLAKGQSEYTHEAYHADPVDAYLNLSFESALWPMIASLVKGEVQTAEQVALQIADAIPTKTHGQETAEPLVNEQPAETDDKRFQLVKTFKLTVPHDYVHETQLTTFSEKHCHEFISPHIKITDQKFANASTRLLPGKKYLVKIFQITQRVSSTYCLSFLKKQQAIFTGAQGISLVWEQKKEMLPTNKFTVSFDEKKALWLDNVGHYRVPGINLTADNRASFSSGNFGMPWDNICLLCFCELPENEQEITTKAKERSNPDDLIRVRRSAGRNAYPAWTTRSVVHPHLELLGPSEYNINRVQEWLHPDQSNKPVQGYAIYEYLKESNTLSEQLGIDDLRAIQSKGVAFFRKHFGNKTICAWKSIIPSLTSKNTDELYVPILHKPVNVSGMVVAWRSLSYYWSSTDVGLRFAEQSNSDDIIRVDRDSASKIALPSGAHEIIYPHLYNTGPVEYNMDQLEEWLHPDQVNGLVSGLIIRKHLKDHDLLESQIGLADLMALEAKGIDFFRRHFADKTVIGWKSVIQDNNQIILVPILREMGNKLGVYWGFADSLLGWRTIGLRFKNRSIFDDIIRVDRSAVIIHYLADASSALHPGLACGGPSDYSINQVGEFLVPGQANANVSGEEIYNYLKENHLLDSQLGISDLRAIKAKGIEFFREHFQGKNVFAWKSIVQSESRDIRWVPCLKAGVSELNIFWLTVSSLSLDNRSPALYFLPPDYDSD